MLALVTADVAAPLDPDLDPFERACGERFGVDAVRVVSWDDPSVDWSTFDATVIRSTWDYHDRLDEFVGWLARIEDATRLINGADAIRWNLDKRYLGDLADEGIPVVPTAFVDAGEPAPPVEGLSVVKPSVGAGSNGARRCQPGEVADHVAHLHASGLTAMVQPYLDLLDEHGESAYCFVAGPDGSLELSHVFGKAAILTSVDVEQEADLFAKEEIEARPPSADERALAERVLSTSAVGSLDDVLFARVDIAPFRDVDGTERHVLMELELIEPSFYLHTAPGSAERFAGRLAEHLGAGSRS